jgi:hypothetical protein
MDIPPIPSLRPTVLDVAMRNGYNPGTYCARCGNRYLAEACVHTGTHDAKIGDEEAARIRARYTFGKRFNPAHDETSYRD